MIITDEIKALKQIKCSEISSENFLMIGDELGKQLQGDLQRDSLLRKVLLNEDGTSLIRQDQKVVRTERGTVEWVSPKPEYYVQENCLLDSSAPLGDQLYKGFSTTLNSLLRQENNILPQLCGKVIEHTRRLIKYSTFSPATIRAMCTELASVNLKPDTLVCGASVYEQLSKEGFAGFFDSPDHESTLYSTHLGILNAFDDKPIKVQTDRFLEENDRVIPPFAAFLFAKDVYAGVWGYRNNLVTQPIEQYNMGTGYLGWFFSQIQYCHLNPHAVVGLTYID